MKLHLVSAARDEAREAALYYLGESPKTAAAFVEQLAAALAQLREAPTTWRPVEDGVRRYLLKQFPFGIYYSVEGDEIVVWAIMHLRRKPNYWAGRRIT